MRRRDKKIRGHKILRSYRNSKKKKNNTMSKIALEQCIIYYILREVRRDVLILLNSQ